MNNLKVFRHEELGQVVAEINIKSITDTCETIFVTTAAGDTTLTFVKNDGSTQTLII